MNDDRNTIILKLLSEAATASCSDKPFMAWDVLLEAGKLLDEQNRSLLEPICVAIGVASSSMARDLARDSCLESQAASNVYFAQRDDGLIKIGFTQDVEARVRQIAPMAGSLLTVLAVDDGGFEEEQRLHKKFRAHRHHGEWFRPAPEIMRHIECLNQKKDDIRGGTTPT